MAIIKRKGKGGISYLVRVKDPDGQWYPAATFAIKVEATDHERELLERRKKGGRVKDLASRSFTFDDWWQKWADEYRMETSMGWKSSQDQMYRDHVKPVLGHLVLTDITRSEIAGLLNACAEKGLGQQTRLHIYRLVSQVFSDAVEEEEILLANPVRESLKPSKPETSRDFLEPDDARAFLEVAAGDWTGPAVWIMTCCGLRIGEMMGLLWRHVDLKKGVITVERQFNNKEMRFGPPKNGKTNTIPMPPDLVEYLAGVKPLDADPESFVQQAQEGGMLSRHTFRGALRRLCKHAGVTELSPHELRHTCSELWIDSGATESDVGRVFNHQSPNSVKPYLHRTEGRLERLSRGLSIRRAKKKTGLTVVKG